MNGNYTGKACIVEVMHLMEILKQKDNDWSPHILEYNSPKLLDTRVSIISQCVERN